MLLLPFAQGEGGDEETTANGGDCPEEYAGDGGPIVGDADELCGQQPRTTQ